MTRDQKFRHRGVKRLSYLTVAFWLFSCFAPFAKAEIADHDVGRCLQLNSAPLGVMNLDQAHIFCFAVSVELCRREADFQSCLINLADEIDDEVLELKAQLPDTAGNTVLARSLYEKWLKMLDRTRPSSSCSPFEPGSGECKLFNSSKRLSLGLELAGIAKGEQE